MYKSLTLAKNIAFIICFYFLNHFHLNAQAGAIDLSYTPGPAADNRLAGIVLQSDGKAVIVGDFLNYNGTPRSRIARLNTDGTLDLSFDPGSGANAAILPPAIQSDGKMVCGGNFTSYNGVPVNRIMRINADGSRDFSFNTGGTGVNSFVYATALQSDGKIIIGGPFTSYNGTTVNCIARLNTDGSLDNTFNMGGTGFNNYAYSISIQSDNKIVVGGNFSTYNGTPRNKIVRLNADGTLDASFNPGGGASNVVYSTAIQTDGKILIGGSFTAYNGTTKTRLARLNSDGSLDVSFAYPGSGISSTVYAINQTSDGKIIIGGQFINYNGISRNRILCLNSDGSLNTDFNPGTGANNIVYTSAIQSDRNILIGGSFTNYNGTTANRIVRLNKACLNADSPTISTNTTICIGQNASLSITSGNLNDATNWQWYESSCGGTSVGTGTNISVSPSVTTVYYVRGEGACTTPLSCSTITVSVNLLPVVSITGASTVCSGYSSTLSASGATSYLWSNGSSSSMTTVTPTINTTYSVIGTDANGCSSASNIAISPLACVQSTSLQAVYCGTTVASLSDRLKCTSVSGATKYEWQVTDIATSTVYLKQSTNNLVDMYLSYIPQVTYNKSYSIRVRALSSGGIWGTFGPSCTVNTPSAPSTKLQTVYCGTTLTALSNRLKCDPVPSTTKYEWEVTDIATSAVYLKQSANNLVDMYLSYIPQVTYNKSYSIRVRALSGGAWGTFGIACTVTTPASAPRARFALSDYEETEIGNSINVNAYPNPTSELLNIDFDNIPANASVEIYNMIGELVLTQSLTELNNTINTSPLANGLYHAKVIGNNKLLFAQKIVKQ